MSSPATTAMELLMSEKVNSTTEQSCTVLPDEPPETRSVAGIALSASVLILIIALSVLGNVAVIIAILKTPHLREKTSNIFLINLGLTDLLNATFVMPSAVVSLIADDWLLGTHWCYAHCAFNYWFIIVSMLTLAMISVDGYFAIIFPMKYANMVTVSVTKLAVCYAWLQGCVFALVPVAYRWVVYDYWEVVCAIDWDTYSQDGALIYVIVAFIACFLIPTCVMVFCYLKISWAVRASAARVPEVLRSVDRKRQDNKVMQSLAVVVVVFAVCMTPFCLTKVLKILCGTKSLPPYLSLVSSWFAFVSSATNPFIYGIFRRDFRRAFAKIFCGKRIRPAAPNCPDLQEAGLCVRGGAGNGPRCNPASAWRVSCDIEHRTNENNVPLP